MEEDIYINSLYPVVMKNGNQQEHFQGQALLNQVIYSEHRYSANGVNYSLNNLVRALIA